MCTAIAYNTTGHFFGRNLDLEHSYNERVIITPRSYPFKFRRLPDINRHYAMIGMGIVDGNYPLYFDAVNEKGLCMAGLNFPDNAFYCPERENMVNVAAFELIPWLLSECQSISEVKTLLDGVNVTDIAFSESFTLTPLHWMISDRKETIVVESVREGLRIYDNPVGVLTNNPAFDMQLFNLNNYMQLSALPPSNFLSDTMDFWVYSRGMGALGLPGDLSSQSRFVKAAFTKLNSVAGNTPVEDISQFFHILGSVEQQKGCVRIEDEYEFTVYSSCCDTDRGIYYYTTYYNSCINGVDMYAQNLEGEELIQYPLIINQRINIQNHRE